MASDLDLDRCEKAIRALINAVAILAEVVIDRDSPKYERMCRSLQKARGHMMRAEEDRDGA